MAARPAEPPGSMSPLRRLLAMAGFGAVAYLLLIALLLLALTEFFLRLFGLKVWSAGPDRRLGAVTQRMAAYIGEILAFLLYRTDDLPFPFRPFPDAPADGAPPSAQGTP